MTTRQEVHKLTSHELQEFLKQELDLCYQTVESFTTNRIDGESFLELSETDLRELVTPLGDRKKIQKLMSSYALKQMVICTGIYTSSCHALSLPSLQVTPAHPSSGVRNPSWIESAIPQVFSCATTEYMEKQVITKSEVGEALSHRVYAVSEHPTSAEYTAVCLALITKYPVLADTYGNGYVSTCVVLLCLGYVSTCVVLLCLFVVLLLPCLSQHLLKRLFMCVSVSCTLYMQKFCIVVLV